MSDALKTLSQTGLFVIKKRPVCLQWTINTGDVEAAAAAVLQCRHHAAVIRAELSGVALIWTIHRPLTASRSEQRTWSTICHWTSSSLHDVERTAAMTSSHVTHNKKYFFRMRNFSIYFMLRNNNFVLNVLKFDASYETMESKSYLQTNSEKKQFLIVMLS